MPTAKRWKYDIGTCYFKPKGKLLSRDGDWILILDKEYGLRAGLDLMGEKGYELIGLQQAEQQSPGLSFTYFYIFKKPLD